MKNKIQIVLIALLGSFISCGPKEGDNEIAKGGNNPETPDYRTPKSGEQFTVGFYNVENLFDLEDDPATDDSDFLPSNQEKPWTAQRYETKLENLASVIAQLGDEDGPELLGLCEVENEAVLQELINTEKLQSRNYGVVHFDSPDGRGIDNALLFKKGCFQVRSASVYALSFPFDPDYKSRDILLVEGLLFGEPLALIVNHWPSRRGGEKESEPRRLIAANRARGIVERLQKENPNASIIVMGDFNDEPTNKSIKERLFAVGKSEYSGTEGELVNAMYELDQQGQGSYKYRSDWNMLDQIIYSAGLMDSQGLEFVENSATVFGPEWLKQQEPAKYKGSPLRTFGGRKYLGGYSDHFPVYVKLELK